jgi:Bromodomain
MNNINDAEPSAPTDNTVKKQKTEEIPNEIVDATLFRLTRGIPKRELALMVSESEECEKLLEQEILLLEKQINGDLAVDDVDIAPLNAILESPLTPLDRYWTASALLGRMRREMLLQSIHTVPGGDPRFFPAPPATTKKTTNTPIPTIPESQFANELVGLNEIPAYTEQQRNSAQLLALWKKISSNRAAHVFKRPVRPEEAPGYTDRIVFPMDLSLIRKLIVSGKICTFQQLHDKIGLICHNCVKYNGKLAFLVSAAKFNFQKVFV